MKLKYVVCGIVVLVVTIFTGPQVSISKDMETNHEKEIIIDWKPLSRSQGILDKSEKDNKLEVNPKKSSKSNFRKYKAPKTPGFKSYMGYKFNNKIIFSKSSKQYKLQLKAKNSSEGIRQVNNRYCVALGSYYSTKIGQYFDLVLKNGTVIPCILADGKDNIHTDSENKITVANGCMSEFIVDTNKISKLVLKMGDISYTKKDWDSPVNYVKIYDKNYFD